MPSVFEVDVDAIELLSDVQLTRLLKHLLHLEAQSAGIAHRAVEVALNITVADGGEDGRIAWEGGPASTDYLPTRLLQFQVKATDMGPAACGNEILNSQGQLKPMIEQVLSSGGSYILFTNRKLNRRQKQNRIDAIRTQLRNLGIPYADSAGIHVYDASTIQGWVNIYLPAVVSVSNWVNRPLVPGMQAWEEWSRREDHCRFPFVPDTLRSDAIQQVREELSSIRKVVRIIGLSGLGKTRLALEIFRPQGEFDVLAKRVVYIDASYGITDLPGRVSDWVRCGFKGIVVVDNCDLGLHKRLKTEITRHDSQLSLLTLDYNPDQDSDTPTISLLPLEDQHIKQMLETLYVFTA